MHMSHQPHGKWLLRVGFALCLTVCRAVAAAPEPAGAAVDFNRDIRPILSSRCLSCHGVDESARKAELRLDQRADVVRNRDGSQVIKPGSITESELIARISSPDKDEVMPPPKSGPPLKPEEIDLLRRWVGQGAKYAEHWAFLPVASPSLPTTSNDSWAKSPIDRFILNRLDQAGLKPAKPADKPTWIRRLSLDLTGLPPTPAEVDAYLSDSSPGAAQKVVDRLLDSPHFGERMARIWLDLARYADSKGYGSDPLREYMWRYRDWVIDAFNRNLPYDRFITDQIAGDLIPNATNDQMLATAFHRNTMANDEGGTDDEEFRVAAIKDRVDTTGQVFMGLTVGCAKCHTHKFDPISQREYYQLFAIFNQTEDNDNPSDEPRIPTPTPAQATQIAGLEQKIKALANLPVPKGKAFDDAMARWTESVRRGTAWQVVRPTHLETTKDRTVVVNSNSEVIAKGTALKATDTIQLKVPKGTTAIRLEALADETEIKGPGLNAHGNFVLSNISGTLDDGKKALSGARYVRIELPGSERMISLAEVQVYRGQENIATKGSASQSSTDFGGSAALAIDGNTNGDFNSGKSVTHTAVSKDPWWELDLKDQAGQVDRVNIWNRTDSSLEFRLAGAVLSLLDANRKPLFSQILTEPPKPNRELVLGGPKPVSFASASSSHDQPGFDVSRAIAPAKAGKNDGWAIGGLLGRTHEAIFRVSTPLPTGTLTLKLAQNWGESHTLGRYKFTISTDSEPGLALPVAIRDLAIGCDCCRAPADVIKLSEYYWRHIAPETKTSAKERTTLEQELSKLRAQVVKTPVLKELPADKRRKTNILVKGNYTQPGDVVAPRVLGSFHPLKAEKGRDLTRLDLAGWVTDKSNPLTARVAVNRFWAMIYGRGLVETEEDFGTQGRSPSHPELLDYLATSFMENGWDVKRLLSQIVLTSTYSQSSQMSEKASQIDPRNDLYSHYPRSRLDAETIRDQALAVSGLFSPTIGGPSVYPPQPANIWQAAFNGQRTWPTSSGPDKYRRGLYTFWRRTTPYPSMSAFDAPSREVCSIRRIGSNTPLQAYVTLNDPVFVEAAQALGRRMIRDGGVTPDSRISYGYKLVTSRAITPERLSVLNALWTQERDRYKADPMAAKAMAESQLGALPAGIPTDEAAALSVIGNVLLNLDAALTKG